MPAWILVCDDEAHIRHIIAHKLRAAGYGVVEARNGQEALTLLDARRAASEPAPRLVISDFQMPVLNGVDLCKALKARPDAAGTPVLMLTARGHVITDEDMARTNIREIIGKPFGVRQLLERVAGMLGEPGAHGSDSVAA